MTTIQTPRGRAVVSARGRATLTWSTDFAARWGRRYSQAQVFVDSEVLRRSEPYVPLRTGALVKSGILGTAIGSGLVQWIAPYARRQYYRGRQPGASSTGSRRGRMWFERMKAVNVKAIIAGAAKLAGGK